jgi:DNA polymerase III subunit delta'
LKILEEPPAHSLLILVTHRLGALIPTIRSRSQLVVFNALTPGDFSNVLKTMDVQTSTPRQEAMLYALAEGRPGLARALIEDEALAMFERLTILFKHYPRWDWEQVHLLAEELGRAGHERAYRGFATLLGRALAQIIMARAAGGPLPAYLRPDGALARIMNDKPLRGLLEMSERLEAHFQSTERSNLEKRQAVLNAFSILAA